MWSVIVRCLVLTFIVAINAPAEEMSTGDIETNSWARPYHFGSPPTGRVFAQTESGFGIRYYFKVIPKKVELYADVNRFSGGLMGPSTTYRLGAQNECRKIGRIGLVFGAGIEMMQYFDKGLNKTHLPVSLSPTFGLRYRRATLTFGYKFAPTNRDEHSPAILTSHLSLRF
jgi:hypothetical protein